jgi:predicted ester cyclase
MEREKMERLIERHITGERERDIVAILATCTPDVEQDAIGRQPNVIRGHDALEAFYREFMADLEYATVTIVRRLYGDDFIVDESMIDAVAHGRPFDMEGYGRPIRFRTLRIFEVGDELIRRVSVWADLSTIHAQLAPPKHA